MIKCKQVLFGLIVSTLMISSLYSSINDLNESLKKLDVLLAQLHASKESGALERITADGLERLKKNTGEVTEALGKTLGILLEPSKRLEESVKQTSYDKVSEKFRLSAKKSPKWRPSQSTMNGIIIGIHLVTRHASERWKDGYQVGPITVLNGPIIQAMGLAGSVTLANNRKNLNTNTLQAAKEVGIEVVSAGAGAMVANACNEAIAWPEHHNPLRAALVWVVKRVTEGFIQNTVHIGMRNALNGRLPDPNEFLALSIRFSTDK